MLSKIDENKFRNSEKTLAFSFQSEYSSLVGETETGETTMMTKQRFIAWLLSKGYVKVDGQPVDTYEKSDVRFIARQSSLGKRVRLSPNRWSAMESWLYSQRYITHEGKLGFVSN